MLIDTKAENSTRLDFTRAQRARTQVDSGTCFERAHILPLALEAARKSPPLFGITGRVAGCMEHTPGKRLSLVAWASWMA